MESKNNKQKSKIILSKLGSLMENIIYFVILIPLVIITLNIVFQQINNPDKVPDIFGWKMFMILDENMDESIKKGDLVFTENIDSNELNVGDIVAFMNDINTVKIHKITDILEGKVEKIFVMQTQEDEIDNKIQVKSSKIEGVVKNKIPYVGSIILFIQQPLSILIIIGVIIMIGLICLYIAKKLDKRDSENTINKNKKNN